MSTMTQQEMAVLSSPSFEEIINKQLQNPARRSLLKGGMGLGALGFLGLAGCGGEGTATAASGTSRLQAVGFSATSFSTADSVQVAPGYQFQVVYKLGDPIAAGVAAYANDGSDGANNPSEFEFRSGDHHDGMYFFGLSASNSWDPTVADHGLLCINHEAITPLFLHVNGPSAAPRNANECLKEMNIQGVSVIEIRRGSNGLWSVVQNSLFNRRITTFTTMDISGPLRGSDFMKTKFSADGTRTRGTINNCAAGYTPWGTYLTCEENWNGYFRNVNAGNTNVIANDVSSLRRYGIPTNQTGRENWTTASEAGQSGEPFSRWNIVPTTAATTRADTGTQGALDYRNAAYTFGYTVEIDPFRPNSTPKKRTAMGRFAHEGAWVGPVEAGKPIVFYMGCDSRFEYIYKFVSAANWDPADVNGGLAVGDKYLDNGKLYVAKFNDDFSGQWLELGTITAGTVITPRNPGALTASATPYTVEGTLDQYVNTRILADHIGGTPMDRPEWGAVNPRNGEVYMTLTNNTSRTALAAVNAANPRAYLDNDDDGDGVVNAGASATYGNVNGHIIRWRETGSLPAATTFAWDIYLFGAELDDLNKPSVNVSGLTNDNFLSSPDGLWFSQKTGVLFIETDDGAFTDTTNCMLLAVVPGEVGDGQTVDIVNRDRTTPATTRTVTTKVGKPGTIRRLLVGPKDCEITGITESGDGKSLFVNIQHPGEESPSLANPTSSWPYPLAGGGFGNPATGQGPSSTNRPRSATIVITRTDGGMIGL
ncbi:MAG TPA: PhoX family phosphatase [Limnobacter sp.]|uniref:PhoX family protein n=1 Tax=Limnobacter sp. TaxID=2003368 RepID=UPI002EDAE545